MQDHPARDHPVPAAADQKIHPETLQDQTEEIKPKSFEKAVRHNDSKSDEPEKKDRVKRVVIALLNHEPSEKEEGQVRNDHHPVEAGKIRPEQRIMSFKLLLHRLVRPFRHHQLSADEQTVYR